MTGCERQAQVPTAVIEALRGAIEPHLGVNVVDLGLVYEVRAERDVLRIVVGFVVPQAGDDDGVAERVESAIRSRLPNVGRIELLRAHEPVWHPGRISGDTLRFLGL
jgi:metal-sulfur cluster biosynthetic enzyme